MTLWSSIDLAGTALALGILLTGILIQGLRGRPEYQNLLGSAAFLVAIVKIGAIALDGFTVLRAVGVVIYLLFGTAAFVIGRR